VLAHAFKVKFDSLADQRFHFIVSWRGDARPEGSEACFGVAQRF